MRHHPDGNDAEHLADDPIHKLLLGRDPVTGDPLASQPFSPWASRLGQPHLGSKRLCADALVDAERRIEARIAERSANTRRAYASALPYVAELHDTGHAATPRHAARVFQIGSAESGSTIKVRSAVRPQTPGQRMVVRVPPFDHPK